jgi:hypothetical protein
VWHVNRALAGVTLWSTIVATAMLKRSQCSKLDQSFLFSFFFSDRHGLYAGFSDIPVVCWLCGWQQLNWLAVPLSAIVKLNGLIAPGAGALAICKFGFGSYNYT